MYYPDGAGLFGEELIRLPDGRVVTREQAMNFQYSGRGVAGMPMQPQGRGAGEVDMNQLRQRIVPPTPARTAPIPTAQPKAPAYPPNPALMAAEAGAPKPEEGGFGGLLDWMGKNPEKKQSFDQSDVLMALGSGMLGLSADPNLQKLGAAGFGQVAERRDERKTTAMTNRTVDALVGSGMIKPEQAEILRNNPALIKEVYGAALKGNVPLSKMGKLAADLKAGRISQEVYDKEVAAIGSPLVDMGNFGNTDVDELRKKLSGGEGDLWQSYLRAGAKSAGLMQDIDLLEQAAMAAPTGPVTGRLLELFPEANNNAAVFNAILQRVAPTMRVEGSGSTSDIEFEGMLKSLGSLRNNPEANQMIYGAFRAKAQLNMERANIIRQYQNGPKNGGLTEQQARDKLYELDSRSILPPELKSIVEAGSRNSVSPKYQQYYDQLPPERQKLFDTLSDADKDRLFDAWFKGKVQ